MYLKKKKYSSKTFLNVMEGLLKRCPIQRDRKHESARQRNNISIRQTRGRNHVSVSCTDIKSHAKSLRQVWRANLHRRHMYTRMHTHTRENVVRRIDRFGSGTFQPPPPTPSPFQFYNRNSRRTICFLIRSYQFRSLIVTFNYNTV